MRLDRVDKEKFLKRFDAKFAEARGKYEEYLAGDVRIGDHINITYSFAINWGESEVKMYEGTS